jgi:hypothetical protein
MPNQRSVVWHVALEFWHQFGDLVEASVIRLEPPDYQQFPRLDDAARPDHYLGRALHALGRPLEAATFARRAYEQAWGEGRPYCRHWDLIEAEALLADLGEEVPDLPDTDMAALRVPLEQESLALIAKERGNDDRAAAG